MLLLLNKLQITYMTVINLDLAAAELIAGRARRVDCRGSREPGQEGRRRGRGSRLGELSPEPRVFITEALAPPTEQVAVELRLLELGARPPVLEPNLHLPRLQPELPRQIILLALQKHPGQNLYLPRAKLRIARKANLAADWRIHFAHSSRTNRGNVHEIGRYGLGKCPPGAPPVRR